MRVYVPGIKNIPSRGNFLLAIYTVLFSPYLYYYLLLQGRGTVKFHMTYDILESPIFSYIKLSIASTGGSPVKDLDLAMKETGY